MRAAPLARALTALLLWGCTAEMEGTRLQLELAASGGSCGGDRPAVSLAGLTGARTIRLSVLGRSSPGGEAALVCDHAVAIAPASQPSGQTHLSFSTAPGAIRDLLVEVFSGGAKPRLLARGMLTGLDLKPRARPLRVLLGRPERFACTPGGMGAARAFHSATSLPNNQVLVLGGVAAGSTATSLRLSSSVAEIYEPRTGTFTAVAGQLPAGRALHSAVLLASSPREGPYDLLLVGGVTERPGDPGGAVLAHDPASGALPLLPAARAEAAPTTLVRLFPWTSPPQMQVIRAGPRLQGRMFHAAADNGQRAVVLAGGLAGRQGDRLTTVDTLELLPDVRGTAHEGPFSLQRARVGAAAVALGATEVLLYGGNLDSPAASVDSEVAESVTLGRAPASKLATLEPSSLSRVSSPAFATLTALGDGDLLLAGGLRIAAGQALEPRTRGPLQRLSILAGSLRVADVPATSFVPVAYHRAATTADGRVLLAGGYAAAGTCPTGSTAPSACDLAYLYEPGPGALRVTDSMRAPRMGHALAQLQDGTVLVTGGLQPGSAPRALKGAELFQGVSARVDPFGRAPGQGSTPCGE